MCNSYTSTHWNLTKLTDYLSEKESAYKAMRKADKLTCTGRSCRNTIAKLRQAISILKR